MTLNLFCAPGLHDNIKAYPKCSAGFISACLLVSNNHNEITNATVYTQHAWCICSFMPSYARQVPKTAKRIRCIDKIIIFYYGDYIGSAGITLLCNV